MQFHSGHLGLGWWAQGIVGGCAHFFEIEEHLANRLRAFTNGTKRFLGWWLLAYSWTQVWNMCRGIVIFHFTAAQTSTMMKSNVFVYAMIAWNGGTVVPRRGPSRTDVVLVSAQNRTLIEIVFRSVFVRALVFLWNQRLPGFWHFEIAG